MSVRLLTISDANVLIDIEEAGLTASMFSLSGLEFCVPDVLFETELKAKHSTLLNLGLKRFELSGEKVLEICSLVQKHSKVSRLDFFALQLAREHSAMLLTGDRALRNVAKQYGVECHGTLWLVELMVQERVIGADVAREAYRKMREAGGRLPWDTAESRLKKLETQADEKQMPNF